MELQSQISWELNQEKIGKRFKCIVDRYEDGYFVARTEFDSPDVDNTVLIDAEKFFLQWGLSSMLKLLRPVILTYTERWLKAYR